MTPDSITELIDAELAEHPGFANPHALDLPRCRVTPERRTFHDSFTDGPLEAWLVLEERPDTRDGYRIVYGEERESFGLVTDGVLIGWYGAFVDAVEGM